MKDKSVNLFAPLTPYNLLLSYALAATETRDEENVLLLVDYDEANEKSESYLRSQLPVFSRTIRLVGSTKRETSLTRPFRKQRFFRAVDDLFGSIRVGKFFSFNDFKFQTQYAIASLAKMQPCGSNIHVEDGTGDYCGVRLAGKSPIRKLRDRLFYGKWFREIENFGTYPLIDGYRFIFPELSNLAPSLQSGKSLGISNAGIRDLVFEENAKRCFGEFDTESIRKRDSIIVFLDSAPYARTTPGYLDKLLLACEKAISEGMNVLVKGKDRNNYRGMGLLEDHRFFRLPGGIPSELLLLWFGGRIRKVVGGKSSALMTARWLTPHIPSYSLCPFITEEDSRLGSLFRKIGVQAYGTEGTR